MSDFQRELNAAEDIVVLMRKWAEVLDIPSGSFVNDDCRKAADEIHSLRVENYALAKSCAAAAAAAAAENYARLRAEVERLRAALDKICNGPRDVDLSYAELFIEVKLEARAALEVNK